MKNILEFKEIFEISITLVIQCADVFNILILVFFKVCFEKCIFFLFIHFYSHLIIRSKNILKYMHFIVFHVSLYCT